MTNYVKATNFTQKDSLPVGDNQKKVKGAEFDVEFNAIVTAIESKANETDAALGGTPTAPTAAAATNTTQIATTAMVQSALGQSDIVDTAQIVDAAVTDAKIADGAVTSVKMDTTTNGFGTRTVSTSDPSGGSDGDIWYKYS